jgi:hypothetical protein
MATASSSGRVRPRIGQVQGRGAASSSGGGNLAAPPLSSREGGSATAARVLGTLR